MLIYIGINFYGNLQPFHPLKAVKFYTAQVALINKDNVHKQHGQLKYVKFS